MDSIEFGTWPDFELSPASPFRLLLVDMDFPQTCMPVLPKHTAPYNTTAPQPGRERANSFTSPPFLTRSEEA